MATYLSRVQGLSVPAIAMIAGPMQIAAVITIIPVSYLVDRLISRPGANGTKIRKILAVGFYSIIISCILAAQLPSIQCKMLIARWLHITQYFLSIIAASTFVKVHI